MLFLIHNKYIRVYINDLQNVFNHNELNIFADDTVLIFKGTCLETIIDEANRKLKLLECYLRANGIKLNQKKTEHMIIRNRQDATAMHAIDPKTQLIYEKAEIEKVETIKLLGVKLDNRLSYKEHMETMIINKIRAYIPVFYWLRNVLYRAYPKFNKNIFLERKFGFTILHFNLPHWEFDEHTKNK